MSALYALFNALVVFTAPLPYVAFMIVDFHMAPDVDTAGYEAGWITGMFMVGRFVAGKPNLTLIQLKPPG